MYDQDSDLVAEMLATPQSPDAKLKSILDAIPTAGLPEPEYCLIVECQACGHVQFPYAINPVFEEYEGEPAMIDCYAGSAADFCDLCEGEPLMTGWGLARDLRPE